MTHCIHCCAYNSCFLLLRKAALRAEHKTINASHVDGVHVLLKVINIHLIKKQGDANHNSQRTNHSSSRNKIQHLPIKREQNIHLQISYLQIFCH